MLAWTVYTSLSDWQGTAPNYTFAGLKWYRFMIGLDRFWVDLDNNLRWLVLGVVPTTVLALCVAYLLEIGAVRGIEAYLRTLVLYPAAMSFVVTGTIWSWMYQADRGVLNTLLRAAGLERLTSGYTTDVLALFQFIATYQQHLVALGSGLAVVIFALAFIIIIPYTIYALQRWFE